MDALEVKPSAAASASYASLLTLEELFSRERIAHSIGGADILPT